MNFPTICIIKAVSDDGQELSSDNSEHKKLSSTNSFGDKHPGIEQSKWDETHLSYNNLKNDIEDFCIFLSVRNTNELFLMINAFVKPNENYIVNIEDLHYNQDYVYQAIFKSPINNSTYQTMIDESNKLATQMLNERHIVDGDMILIKRCIINNDFNYENMTFNDVYDILKSQILHKATIIKPDNLLSNTSYLYDALEIRFDQSHLDNSRSHEFRFLDFRLFFNIDTKAIKTDENLNMLPSIIFNKRIYGNCVVSLCDNADTPKPFDLTEDIIQKIYLISLRNTFLGVEIDRKKYGRKMDVNNRTFTDEQVMTDNFVHNNFPEITLCPNFFYVIKKEYNDIIKTFNITSKSKEVITTYLNTLPILNDIE